MKISSIKFINPEPGLTEDIKELGLTDLSSHFSKLDELDKI